MKDLQRLSGLNREINDLCTEILERNHLSLLSNQRILKDYTIGFALANPRQSRHLLHQISQFYSPDYEGITEERQFIKFTSEALMLPSQSSYAYYRFSRRAMKLALGELADAEIVSAILWASGRSFTWSNELIRLLRSAFPEAQELEYPRRFKPLLLTNVDSTKKIRKLYGVVLWRWLWIKRFTAVLGAIAVFWIQNYFPPWNGLVLETYTLMFLILLQAHIEDCVGQ